MPWHSRSPAETHALARGLAEALPGNGGVVTLNGPLGAGKTVFAKGLAEGLGVDPARLASPTFVLASELPLGPGARIERLVHADFYRIEHGRELEAAGLDDWLAPGTLLLAEWGERFAEWLPEDRLEVALLAEGAESRGLRVRAHGPVAEDALARWRDRCP
jgi:tRNA threonylcarbamoyladenosine biosynthesis protein TsaE